MTEREYILKNKLTIPFNYISDDITDCYHREFGENFNVSFENYEKLVEVIKDIGVDEFDNNLKRLKKSFIEFNSKLDKSYYDDIKDKLNVKNEFEKDDIGKIFMVFYMPYSIFYELYEFNILEKIKLECNRLYDKELVKLLSKKFFEDVSDRKIELFVLMYEYFNALVKKFGVNVNDIYFNENFEIMYFRVSLQNIDAFKKAIKNKVETKFNVKFDVFKLISDNLLFNAKNKKFLTKINNIDTGIDINIIEELLQVEKEKCK